MENFNNIHWVAVLVATLGYFFLGFVWYSLLFGKKWRQYANVDMNAPDAKKGTVQIMVLSFVFMFISSMGLAILATKLDLHGALSGAKLGFFTGFCFSAMAIHISYIYEKKPVGLHLINGVYNIEGCIIAAIIICSWR